MTGLFKIVRFTSIASYIGNLEANENISISPEIDEDKESYKDFLKGLIFYVVNKGFGDKERLKQFFNVNLKFSHYSVGLIKSFSRT